MRAEYARERVASGTETYPVRYLPPDGFIIPAEDMVSIQEFRLPAVFAGSFDSYDRRPEGIGFLSKGRY